MLNSKQKMFIAEFLKTGEITSSCDNIGIARSTYTRWLKNEEFSKELGLRQSKQYENALNKLGGLFSSAVETYDNLLSSDDESIRYRAAKAIVEDAYKLIKARELAERVDIIEQKVRETIQQNNFSSFRKRRKNF